MPGQFIGAFRSLRQTPGLAALAALSLALGIGLTTAMFGIAYGFVLKGLPFEDGDRIVAISRTLASSGSALLPVPIRDYERMLQEQTAFEQLAAFTNVTFNLSGGDQPQRVAGAAISASAFRVLREEPILGRAFTAQDDAIGSPRVAIIAYELWRDRFRMDPEVVGRMIQIDGYESNIVGVMGDGFEFPVLQSVWIPLRIDPSRAAPNEGQLRVFGRLAEGLSAERAQAQFDTIAANLARQHPQSHADAAFAVRPYVQQFIGPRAAPLLFLMVAAGALVLLIACANVANLLLTRAVGRHREVVIRAALGAGRGQLIVNQLIEAFLLVTIGAVGGIVIAQQGIRLFYDSIAPGARPFWMQARIEPGVLFFVAVLMLVSTLAAGVLPALRASSPAIADVLRDESRGSSGLRIGRLSRWLVMAEIAASAALLVAAGLMVKSMDNFASMPLDFTAGNVFTASLSGGEGDFDSIEQRFQFFDDVEAGIGALPGVMATGIASELPVVGVGQASFEIEGVVHDQQRARPMTRAVLATAGMFEVFEMPAIEGHLFGESDDGASLPVVVVNASFVARWLDPGKSSLGHRLRFHGPDGASPWVAIVGVVPDAYLEQRYSFAPPDAIYTPLKQRDLTWGGAGAGPAASRVVARTVGEPMAITDVVRDTVARVNSNIPLSLVLSFQQTMDAAYAAIGAIGGTFAVFGVMALFLAATGLYGVMSFSTSQRTREVGVRMALGAGRSNVFAMILRDALAQLAVGLSLGLVAGYGIAHLLQFALFDVEPLQVGIMAGVAIVLAAAGLLAVAMPARRAARVDPLVAIRSA